MYTRPPVQFQFVAWTTSKMTVAAICRIQDYTYISKEGKNTWGFVNTYQEATGISIWLSASE